MFPLVVGIMAGMDQKDSNAVFLKPRSSSTTAVACLLLVFLFWCTSRCVPTSATWSVWCLWAVMPFGSGHARRRPRYWHVHAWYCWLDALRAVFRGLASWSVWTGMSFMPRAVAVLVVVYGSGMSIAGFAGYALCSLWSSTGRRCSASWPVWTRRTVTQWWCARRRLRQWHVFG